MNIDSRLQKLEQERKRLLEASRVPKTDVKEHIAKCYLDTHEDIIKGKYEFYNLTGGRGSCKSSFCSLEIIDQIMKDKTRLSNALVVRKYAVTLRGSVYTQIQWAIDKLNASHKWKATLNPLQFVYLPTGQTVRLTGLDNAEKLKSIKAPKGYYKFLWLEEFSEIDGELELRNLQQSVLRGGDKFVVFRSFNPPISKNNWANTFVSIPDARSKTILTDYRSVPVEWLGEEFFTEAERLKEINPNAYEHEYLGIPVGNGSEVFPNIEVREITDKEVENAQYIYQGIDFGFAVDPFCFIKASYDRKHETVMLLDEIYERGWSNAQIAEEIIKRGYDNYYVTCDCAEPKSIVDLRTFGIYAKACYKRQGCVEFRTKWMQHRTIVIDPKRTPNAHREFINYSYAVDKNGQILSQLVDKDNHAIDATAYALTRLIFTQETTN